MDMIMLVEPPLSICEENVAAYSEKEITRIIILTILHTSWQHCHCRLVMHGQDSLRRGNIVHDNELAIE